LIKIQTLSGSIRASISYDILAKHCNLLYIRDIFCAERIRFFHRVHVHTGLLQSERIGSFFIQTGQRNSGNVREFEKTSEKSLQICYFCRKITYAINLFIQIYIRRFYSQLITQSL